MWKLFQLVVFVGTGCALIYWGQHEPDPEVRQSLQNGYLIAALGVAAAWLATMAIWLPMELVRWLRGRKQQARAHQGLDQRILRRGTRRIS
jgi:hypothetical protein